MLDGFYGSNISKMHDSCTIYILIKPVNAAGFQAFYLSEFTISPNYLVVQNSSDKRLL